MLLLTEHEFSFFLSFSLNPRLVFKHTLTLAKLAFSEILFFPLSPRIMNHISNIIYYERDYYARYAFSRRPFGLGMVGSRSNAPRYKTASVRGQLPEEFVMLAGSNYQLNSIPGNSPKLCYLDAPYSVVRPLQEERVYGKRPST